MTRAKFQELVDYLCGTANSLLDGMRACSLEDEDESEIAVKIQEDGSIFLCETCGWWCEIDEMTEPETCSDCCPESDDEE